MVELENVVKTYNKGKPNAFEVLHGVSLKVNDGEMVAVIGKSGAGKSTLLHILGCIDTFDSGSYSVAGSQVDEMSEKVMAKLRNEKIGIVMQDFALVDEFNALENVMIPLDFADGKLKKSKKERKKLAYQALKKVNMDSFATQPVNSLSGGQKQRVAIARAIVNNPAFILADEPTGALDSGTSDEIMKVFKELNKDGKTIIIVTHDMEVAGQCRRVIEIVDGKIEDK